MGKETNCMICGEPVTEDNNVHIVLHIRASNLCNIRHVGVDKPECADIWYAKLDEEHAIADLPEPDSNALVEVYVSEAGAKTLQPSHAFEFDTTAELNAWWKQAPDAPLFDDKGAATPLAADDAVVMEKDDPGAIADAAALGESDALAEASASAELTP